MRSAIEAAFLGIMVFGWQRVNPYIHYLSTILVTFGANLSSFWILVLLKLLQFINFNPLTILTGCQIFSGCLTTIP